MKNLADIEKWIGDASSFVRSYEKCEGSSSYDVDPFTVVFTRHLRSMTNGEVALLRCCYALKLYGMHHHDVIEHLIDTIARSRNSTITVNWHGRADPSAARSYADGIIDFTDKNSNRSGVYLKIHRKILGSLMILLEESQSGRTHREELEEFIGDSFDVLRSASQSY